MKIGPSTLLRTGCQLEARGNSKIKIIGLALYALLFALCSFAEPQPQAKIFKIGYLSAQGTSALVGCPD